MAIAALVLGILGTLFSLVGFLFWLGIPLGLIALILGIVARKNAVANQQPTGMPTAGMVLGIVALVLGLVVFAFCAVAVHKVRGDLQKAANDPAFQEKLKQQQEFNDAFQKAVRQHADEQKGAVAPATPPPGAPTPPALPPPAGTTPPAAAPAQH